MLPIWFRSQLEELYIADIDLIRIPDADFFEGFTNLRVLDLERNNLVYELLGNPDRPQNTAVGPLINLSPILVPGQSRRLGVPIWFRSQLEELYIADIDLIRIPDADFFEGFTNLRVLDLERNNLVYELLGNPDRPQNTAVGPLINPEVWRELPNLRKLKIGSNRILTLPQGFFRYLTRLEELDMFDMWYEYHPYGFGSQSLPAGVFEGLSNLRKLDLRYNAIGATAVDDGLFDGLTGIREIDLRINPLLTLLPSSVLDLPAGVVIRTDPGVVWPFAGMKLSVAPDRVAEDGGRQYVEVMVVLGGSARSVATPVEVRVAASTATEGEDFLAVSSFPVTIAATETSGVEGFYITPVNDAISEGNELVSVSGSAEGFATRSVSLRITDDESSTPITPGGGGGGGGSTSSAPAPPRNLTAVGGNGQVVLAWDAPERDGGAAITDYEYRIDRRNPWTSIGSTDTTHTITGLVNGTAYVFEVRAVNAVGKSFSSSRAEATPEAPEVFTLDFAHFANGTAITSDLVFVNLAPQPALPAIYFYDTEGAPIAAESVVDVTGDLEITEDGGLTVQTEMEPLGELTVSTHGRGLLVTGSVKVVSDGPIGGMLRYDLPHIGEAVVGAGPPLSDALFPVRRQEGGINTGVAIHNLEEEPMEVSCRLMSGGAVLEEVEIPLEANGQTSWPIDQAFPGTDTSDFAGSVGCNTVGEGLFTAVALEMDSGTRIFTTLPVVPVDRGRRGGEAVLDFAHFANGTSITSDLVFVNVKTQPSGRGLTPFDRVIPSIRPAIYFYDTQGNPIAAESVVDVTGDLEIREDGSLTVRTEMDPLGVLTIATHGRGALVTGSVRVVSARPIGGMLRYNLPHVGEAVVGASPPLSDALFPVRLQEGGINTGVAIHNLEEEPMEVSCDLMREGVLRDAVSIPLEANGQTSWFIDQAFPAADTSDFVGSVRCDAVGEGRFSAVALEMDPAIRTFTTLPVFPVPVLGRPRDKAKAESGATSSLAALGAAALAKAHPWPPVESAVTNLRAESDEVDFSLTLSWNPPTYETNFRIRDYRYRIDYRKWVTVSRNARSVRFDTVSPPLNSGQRYRFQVRARFGTRITGRFAGKKTTIWATAPGGTVISVPDPPNDLSYEFIGDSVHLTWTIYPGSSEVLRWEVRIGRNGQWRSTNSTRPSWAYGPHPPGTDRTYYVRGVNRHGDGDASLIDIEREPASSNVPAPVTAFTHAEVGRHKYRLSWTRGTRHYDPRDPVTSYHIYGISDCRAGYYIHPYRPSDRDQSEFSIIVTWAFINDQGVVMQPEFGMRAENSVGIGGCEYSRASAE